VCTSVRLSITVNCIFIFGEGNVAVMLLDHKCGEMRNSDFKLRLLCINVLEAILPNQNKQKKIKTKRTKTTL